MLRRPAARASKAIRRPRSPPPGAVLVLGSVLVLGLGLVVVVALGLALGLVVGLALGLALVGSLSMVEVRREAHDAKGPAGTAQQREHQAILDVLDGLYLLLLREVFRGLRTAAELTPKVHRPTLYTLRTYHARVGVTEAGDDEASPVA